MLLRFPLFSSGDKRIVYIGYKASYGFDIKTIGLIKKTFQIHTKIQIQKIYSWRGGERQNRKGIQMEIRERIQLQMQIINNKKHKFTQMEIGERTNPFLTNTNYLFNYWKIFSNLTLLILSKNQLELPLDISISVLWGVRLIFKN